MNLSKVILPIGSCHSLANKAERLIRLHLGKRDSDSDKWARKTDDTSSQVCSTQYRVDTTSISKNRARRRSL